MRRIGLFFRHSRAALLAAILVGFFTSTPALATFGPENVLVIVNGENPDSVRVGRAYLEKRGVPEKNLCALAVGGKFVSREVYETQVRDVIEKHIVDNDLKDTIRILLTTYGTPYNIGIGQRGDRTLVAVDNELTLLFHRELPPAGYVPNPLYFANNPASNFPPPPQGIYLVSRLEAVDADTAIGLIDKALAAERDGLNGIGYFDARGLRGRTGYGSGDVWIREARRWVAGAGFETVVDNNEALFPRGSTPNAAFYFGWYRHSRFHDSFDKTFPPGAIAIHIASFEAKDLQEGNFWCKRFLEDGVTATAGPVEEPYLFSFMQHGAFWQAIVTGKSLVEAYWLSVPLTRWRMICLGDPLYRPFATHRRAVLTLDPAWTDDPAAPGGRGAPRWEAENVPVFRLTYHEDGPGVIERLTLKFEGNDPRIEWLDMPPLVVENLAPGESRLAEPGTLTLKARDAAPAPPGPDDTEALLTWTASDGGDRTWTVPLRLPVGYRPLVDTPNPATHPTPHPDGRRLAWSDGVRVFVRDLTTHSERTVAALPAGFEPHELYWSPNGRHLAAIARRRTGQPVPPENVETQSRIIDTQRHTVFEGPQLTGVTYHGVDDGGGLLFQSGDGMVRLDPADGRQTLLFRAEPGAVYTVAPGFDKIVRYLPFDDNQPPRLALVNMAGQPIKTYENLSPAPPDSPPSIVWNAAGTRFSISQHSGRIDVIDVEAGKLASFPEAGRDARLDPTGERLAFETLRVVRHRLAGAAERPDSAEARAVTEAGWTERPWVAPSGERVAVQTPAGLELRDALGAEASATLLALGPQDRVAALAWSWDGRHLALRVEGGAREENLLYDIERKTLRRVLPGTAVRGLTWSADNARLYVAMAGASITFDPATGEAEATLRGNPPEVFWRSPDGTLAVRIVNGDRLHLHDAEGKPLRSLGRATPGAQAFWSGDSRRFYVVNARGNLTQWAAPEAAALIGPDGEPNDIALKSRRLAGGIRHLSTLADGGAVWFTADRRLHLHRRPEGDTRALATADSFTTWWTPGGEALGFAATRRGRFSLIMYGGGEAPVELGSIDSLGQPRAPLAWTRHAAIVSSNRNGTLDLWEVPFE